VLVALSVGAIMMAQAVVVRPVANMYKQPTKRAEVVSQAICGSNLDIVGKRRGWLRVRTDDDYTGWVAASDTRRVRQLYAVTASAAEVESLFAHIYRQPDLTKQAPMLTVPFETRLETIGEPAPDARWLRVRLPDGRAGFVQRGDVTLDRKPITIDEAIALSKRFLGLPYTWGGRSSFGYDCSGLTQMLCRRMGAQLPRDADQQAAWPGVVPVDRTDLRAGDLLFFGSAADRITHTGMYLGDGKFINATTWMHPVVQICDLNDEHWQRLLVACRRLK